MKQSSPRGSRDLSRHGTPVTRVAFFAMAVLVVLSLAVVAGCGSSTKSDGSSGSASPGKPMQLKVMVFNIEYGGTQISFKKTVEAVKAGGADIVGIEEGETNIPRLAKAAGYPYYNTGSMIIAKYPIIEPSGSKGAYAFIEVQTGKVVAISNVHLPSSPYGVYFASKGKPAADIVALEQRVRLPAIATQLELLPPLAKQGIPVFVTGDFNSPSHLDWIEAMVGARPQIKEPIEWPVSKALIDAGFHDSWRDVYPDPVANPGLTWWAARPKVSGDWNPKATSPQDRIDFVYAAGPAKTTASEIVGEKGGPEVSIPVTPWPSDHRAVVSTFSVTPGEMPVLVATDKWLIVQGDPLQVTYHAADGQSQTVAVTPNNEDENPGTGTVDPVKVEAGTSGALSVDTTSLAPGAYLAVLADNEGTQTQKTPFWVQAKNAKVELSTDKTTYAPGDPIVVTWANAPANRWDWLGVYKASAADPNVDWYLIWQYTGGATSGTMHGMPAGSLTMEKGTIQGSPWPLPPGKYVVYYLLADGYEAAAGADFTVAK
jgi:endonuclease/exonuclease/phosphatase family metal-dependent hydrolase